MPAFCARWPDGSFSIVDADDKVHALILLDELGDEPAELWQMQSCLLDFELTDDGEFRIRQFGEETGPEIMERAYPVLGKLLQDETFADHPMEDCSESLNCGPEAREALRKAVDIERNRLKEFQRTSAATEAGKGVQDAIGGSGAYIDALVQQVAGRRLKRFKPARNTKPS
jgi:hypothetical protein